MLLHFLHLIEKGIMFKDIKMDTFFFWHPSLQTEMPTILDRKLSQKEKTILISPFL